MNTVYIGYACLNDEVPLKKINTFRLASYSEERLKAAVSHNLAYLKQMLEYNVEHNIVFFRISSDMVPFASHPVCTFNWAREYALQFKEIGEYIKLHYLRISFHPDQFVLINSPSDTIFKNSVAELEYHATMLELMELDPTHKIQIHVGGVYGDKTASMERFIQRFKELPIRIQTRLVIENDDRLYSLKDCVHIHDHTGVPLLFDIFHHECLNNGESMTEALALSAATWREVDGIPMLDYSSQDTSKRLGAHTESIDVEDFKNMLPLFKARPYCVMLEVKDKQKSALKAIEILQNSK